MENKNSISELLKKLVDLLITLLGICVAIIGALFTLLKNLASKLQSGAGSASAGGFDKEKFVWFVKKHKIALVVGLIILFALMMFVENMLYTPTIPSGNTYSNSGYSSLELCYKCHGKRYCVICKGQGKVTNYGFTSECNGCNGNKLCTRCKGTGFE